MKTSIQLARSYVFRRRHAASTTARAGMPLMTSLVARRARICGTTVWPFSFPPAGQNALSPSVSDNGPVGKLYHHAEKRYATGRTILKTCLYYRGVTIPWGSWPCVKKPDAAGLGASFATLTELAARGIKSLPFPPHFPVTVLLDSYYLCANVVRVVEAKGWHYIGVAKSNRRVNVEGAGRGGQTTQ